MGELKKNHHYVPQLYLNAWASPDLYVMINGKIEKRNPKSIAKEKYFYHLEELSQNDLLFIDFMTKNMNEHALKRNESWKQIYTTFSNITKSINESANKTADDERLIREVRMNTDENLFSSIENEVQAIIKAIIEEKKIPDKDESLSMLCFFIGMQYFRTKRMKDAFERSIAETITARQSVMSSDELHFFESLNAHAIWTVLSKYFATNLGLYFYANTIKHHTLYLIHNHTNLAFLTCDQPTINLKASGKYQSEIVPKEFDLYYPISPNLALFFAENGADAYLENTENITIETVQYFNDKIANHAFEQVYSNDKKLLETYLKS